MNQIGIYLAETGNLIEFASLKLDRDIAQTGQVRLYIRCTAGFYSEDASLNLLGLTSGQWSIAPDVNGSPGAYLGPSVGLSVGFLDSEPFYFWVKATSQTSESIGKDLASTLAGRGVIREAEDWGDLMLTSYKTLNPEQAIWLEATPDGQDAQVELWQRFQNGGYLQSTFGHKTECDFLYLLKAAGNLTGRDVQKTGDTLRWDVDGSVYTQNNIPSHSNASIVTVSSTDGWGGITKFFIEDNPLSGGCPRFAFNNCTELNIRDSGLGYSLPNFQMPLTGFSCRGNNFSGDIPPLHFPNIASGQFRLDDNDFTSVEGFLAGLWETRADYTDLFPSVDISGNAEPEPAGVNATDPSPNQPSNGKEYIYSLMNDPFVEGFNKWTVTPDYKVDESVEGKLKVRNYDFSQVFTQEVYDYYHNNVVPDYNHANYNTVVYVDPDYVGGGNNGSISNPYTSVMNVPISSNMAIRIKRGTTHEISGSYGNYDMPSNAAHIFFGAYGEGPRPIMTGDNIRFRGWYPVVRDIEGKFAYTHSNRAHNAIMFNIKSGNVWTFSHNLKAIGCEFSYTGRNGMFVQQWDLDVDQHTEIAYCYIHHVNQRWHSDNKSQSYADGDGIQFSQYRGSYHIHNCIVDRSDTGNKFCIIVNAHTNGGHMLSGLIENNWLFGPNPYPDGGAVIYLGNTVAKEGEPSLPTSSAYHYCTIRKNRILGSDYQGSWTSRALYTNSTLTFFYGNILVDLREAARMGSAFGESEFWNNTFVQPKSTGNAVSHQIHHMYNNIFPHSSHGSATASGNNINLSTYSDTNVFIDPLTEDFRLKVGSPAIDAGSFQGFMTGKYPTDLRGVVVPQNNNIDIGAMQA